MQEVLAASARLADRRDEPGFDGAAKRSTKNRAEQILGIALVVSCHNSGLTMLPAGVICLIQLGGRKRVLMRVRLFSVDGSE
jgi:hypothetical protein